MVFAPGSRAGWTSEGREEFEDIMVIRRLARWGAVMPLALAAAIAALSSEVNTLTRSSAKPQRKIVLIGASVGRAWDLPGLPDRHRVEGYAFSYIGHGGFDKSAPLAQVLYGPEGRPDAVILKECAAYFPGDLAVFKQMMTSWIDQCLEAGVVPIPATVVPVTRSHSFKKFGIDIVKLRNPFRQGIPFQYKRQKQILEYNDWIRSYGQAKGLAVLDLEKAVRKSDRNRFLAGRLAKVDGLHLNRKAYLVLDPIVAPTLESAFR